MPFIETSQLESWPEVNDSTLETATQQDVIALAQTSLIGTILTPEGRSAYLKLSQGRVQRVQPGDIVDGAVVKTIEDGVLQLARGDVTRALRIPGM